MSARIWTRSFASRFESGSSIRKTLGWRMIARPIATRCRCPPESCEGLRSRYSGELEREADVLSDREVGVEGVVLKDHRHVPVLRRRVRHVALADPDAAG